MYEWLRQRDTRLGGRFLHNLFHVSQDERSSNVSELGNRHSGYVNPFPSERLHSEVGSVLHPLRETERLKLFSLVKVMATIVLGRFSSSMLNQLPSVRWTSPLGRIL